MMVHFLQVQDWHSWHTHLLFSSYLDRQCGHVFSSSCCFALDLTARYISRICSAKILCIRKEWQQLISS
jgi:hypothetical protein